MVRRNVSVLATFAKSNDRILFIFTHVLRLVRRSLIENSSEYLDIRIVS